MAETTTALLVDDDPEVLVILRHFLEQGGINVITASDGMEAINYLGEEEFKVDVVIADVRMPNLDGIGLCRTFCDDYPFVLTSGKKLAKSEKRSLETGEVFVPKHCAQKDLVNATKEAISNWNLIHRRAAA
jgi:CheY-like chemotaxis protein